MDVDAILTRLWSKTEVVDGCWRLGQTNHAGYGRLSVDNHSRLAHCLVWEMLRGPIPTGLDVGHICHDDDAACVGGVGCPHRACWNPDHLKPQTRRENLLAGNTAPAANAAKTECASGHPFDDTNTYVYRGRVRMCRACNRERQARRRLTKGR